MSKWLVHRRIMGGSALPIYRVIGICVDGCYPYELMGVGESFEEAEENLINDIKEVANHSHMIEVES